MTKPLSIDLRERLVAYVLEGHSRREAAAVFRVGVSSAIRCVAQHEKSGSVEPKKQGGDRRSKLKAHRAYLLQRVEEVPDISLSELVTELASLGVGIHPSNLSRFLRAEGLSYKKNTGRRRAATRRRPSATD